MIIYKPDGGGNTRACRNQEGGARKQAGEPRRAVVAAAGHWPGRQGLVGVEETVANPTPCGYLATQFPPTLPYFQCGPLTLLGEVECLVFYVRVPNF